MPLKLSQIDPSQVHVINATPAASPPPKGSGQPLRLSQIDPSSVSVVSSPGSSDQENPSAPGVVQTALEHYANGATLGYLPHLQALAEDPIFYALNKAHQLGAAVGLVKPQPDVQSDSYVQSRDQNIKRLADEAAANPKTAIASEIGGALADTLIAPGGPALEASSIGGGLAKGALTGAAYGALSNPGDTQGVVDPLQLKTRAKNAAKGAAIGGVTGLATQGIAKGIRAVSNAPKALSETANTQAVKASGAMLKDFRALNGANRTRAIGEFALDNGLVKAGDTFEDVGAKAETLQKNAGKRLDDLYSRAEKAIPKANEDASSRFSTMAEDEFQKTKDLGFAPVRDKETIINQIKDDLGDQLGADSAVKMVSDYLDRLGDKYGDKVLTPKIANNIEADISKKINFLRNPLTAHPEGEQALKTLRKYISNKVDQHIEYLGKYMNDPEAAEKLAKANRDYGFSKNIAQMAKDKAQRLLANQRFGLTDKIAGFGGGTIGAIAGSEMGGKDGAIEGGLIGGVAMGALNHFGRSYGDAVLANALRGASRIANAGPAQAARLASNVINPATANALTRAASAVGTNHYNQGENFSSTPETETPEQVPIFQGDRIKPSNTASNTQKGPSRWANDGFQKLQSHAQKSNDKSLNGMKGALLSDPKAKQMLVAASDLKPGSKAMDKILTRLKNRLKREQK